MVSLVSRPGQGKLGKTKWNGIRISDQVTCCELPLAGLGWASVLFWRSFSLHLKFNCGNIFFKLLFISHIRARQLISWCVLIMGFIFSYWAVWYITGCKGRQYLAWLCNRNTTYPFFSTATHSGLGKRPTFCFESRLRRGIWGIFSIFTYMKFKEYTCAHHYVQFGHTHYSLQTCVYACNFAPCFFSVVWSHNPHSIL